jgi:hypothetical protein
MDLQLGMIFKKLRCRLVAYSLLWTLAFGMFAPVIGQGLALERSAAGFLVAVCTSTGIQYIKLETTDQGHFLLPSDGRPTPNATLHDQACAVCASGTDTGPLTPTDRIRNPLPRALAVPAHQVRVTPQKAGEWTPHIARAPPGQKLSTHPLT